MSELTDFEICKRIAEIEGVDVVNGNIDKKGVQHLLWYDGGIIKGVYNPLKDDALCFRLMVKYRPFLTPKRDGLWTARIWLGDVPTGNSVYESPNKAVCLAIIEANKES